MTLVSLYGTTRVITLVSLRDATLISVDGSYFDIWNSWNGGCNIKEDVGAMTLVSLYTSIEATTPISLWYRVTYGCPMLAVLVLMCCDVSCIATYNLDFDLIISERIVPD